MKAQHCDLCGNEAESSGNPLSIFLAPAPEHLGFECQLEVRATVALMKGRAYLGSLDLCEECKSGLLQSLVSSRLEITP